MTYFLGLVLSGMVALLLRGLVRWVSRDWQPASALSRRNVVRAILRALPVAVAFAPTLLLKRGLGVLIPASIFLFPGIAGLPFQSTSLDADDRRNLVNAATSFTLVWAVSAFILFVRQSIAIEKEHGEQRA